MDIRESVSNLSEIRNDFIDYQKKLKIQKDNYFNEAFQHFIKKNNGKTVREIRKLILEEEIYASEKGDNPILNSSFFSEMRRKTDELVENQVVQVKEGEV